MRSPHCHRLRLQLECLEDRCVPSTFTVTNLKDDSSAGSLRGAITKANDPVLHPGLDTIVFRRGLEGAIHLNGTEISITDSLILVGLGAGKIAINGNFASRIFNIDDGNMTADLHVTLRGLELLHGKTTANGGAILSNEELKLIHMVFTENQAEDSGGAIRCGRKLVVKKSTIAGNTAASVSGGGISCDTITITGSTISGNTADNEGGGISCDRATITKTTIRGNRAQDGGGVSCDTVTITASTISDNSGTNGGGINGDTVTISGSTISGNSANKGGGIDGYSVTITDTTVSGNTATNGGGFLCKNATLTASTIRDNHADAAGGGIYGMVKQASTISRCTISGNSANKGGGLYLHQGAAVLTVRNSTISGNQASTGSMATNYGGGIYSLLSEARFENCTIAFNQSRFLDGGIAAKQSTIKLSSTIVAQNVAAGFPDVGSSSAVFEVEHSLIGNKDGPGADLHDNGGNLLGSTGNELDPLLAPLAFNGGPTMTHALKRGSPAINKGSNTVPLLASDQRGLGHPRQLGPAVDIGAFEKQ